MRNDCWCWECSRVSCVLKLLFQATPSQEYYQALFNSACISNAASSTQPGGIAMRDTCLLIGPVNTLQGLTSRCKHALSMDYTSQVVIYQLSVVETARWQVLTCHMTASNSQ